MAEHRHRFRYAGYQGRTKILFRCPCGETKARKPTKDEARWLRDDWAESGRIHRVWHDFDRHFIEKDSDKFLYEGADLQDRVEKWAKKYPKDVRFVGCDDSYFSSSLLVLIEHRTAKTYMGTTVVFLPQCSGDPPAQFFLYPGHAIGLMEALRDIRLKAKSVERGQAEWQKRTFRWRP